MISTDLFATLSAAAELPLPQKAKLDSVNLLPYLTGEAQGDPHSSLYWRQGEKRALRKGDLKIVRQFPSKQWKLFDLSKDISEQHDLSASQPERLDELVNDWNELNSQMVEPAFR